jgi:hypothetical protein
MAAGSSEAYFRRVVQPSSIVSVALSISVIITVLVFPNMIRGKIFIQIVALISFCDTMGNWPYMLNYYPANGTVLCSFEGFCNLFFFPVSWMLTTFLMKLFRDVAVHGKVHYSLGFVLLVTGGVPLVITLLQLTTNTYGNEGDYLSDSQPCTIGGNTAGAFMWHLITYNCLLYLCLLIVIVYLVEINWREMKGRIKSNSEVYRLMKRVLILYPVAMLLCWSPHAMCLNISVCSESLNTQGIIDAVKILHGGCVALIFYIMSKEPRRRWYELLASIPAAYSRRPLADSTSWESDIMRQMEADTTTSNGDSFAAALEILPDDANLEAMFRKESVTSSNSDRKSELVLGSTVTVSPIGSLVSNINSTFL